MSYAEFLEEKPPSDGALDLVASLALQQDEADREVRALEGQLKAAKERLRQIAEDRLPTAMADCHVRTFTTQGGLSVKVEEKFRASGLDDKSDGDEGKKRPLTERIRALEYLEDQGHGDLVKRTVQVVLGANSQDVAAELVHLLRQHRLGNQLRIEEFRVVHPMTLQGHVRADLREGGDPDLELLGVSRVTIAKVVRAAKQTMPDEEPF